MPRNAIKAKKFIFLRFFPCQVAGAFFIFVLEEQKNKKQRRQLYRRKNISKTIPMPLALLPRRYAMLSRYR